MSNFLCLTAPDSTQLYVNMNLVLLMDEVNDLTRLTSLGGYHVTVKETIQEIQDRRTNATVTVGGRLI